MISISINNQWSVSASTIGISISMSISNLWSASASMISISINNDCTPRRQSLRHGYLAKFAWEWLKLKINARRSWWSWSYCNVRTASRTASSSKNASPSATMGQHTKIRYALQVRVRRECKKWSMISISINNQWSVSVSTISNWRSASAIGDQHHHQRSTSA